MTREELALRLREVTIELGGLHRELALVRMEEAKAKAGVFRDGQAPSVAAMDREATYVAIDFTLERIRLQGEIDAQNEEKTYLQTMLEILRLDPEAE